MKLELTPDELAAVRSLVREDYELWSGPAQALGLDYTDIIRGIVSYAISPDGEAVPESILPLLQQFDVGPRQVLDAAFRMDRELERELFVPRLLSIAPSLFESARRRENVGTTIAPSEGHSERRREAVRSVQLEPGDIFVGRYVAQQLIGYGGFGWVYRAREKEVGAEVALKLIEPRDGVQQRESTILSLFKHAAIIPLFDWGITETAIEYLVMKLCAWNLREYFEERSLTTEEALSIVSEIAEAVSFVHTHGYVHLDIKPDNILVDEAARVYISDFGLALDLEAAAAARHMRGTIGYASPEQISGDAIDERADVFSLGVVLYQLLTGRNPFAVTGERLHRMEYYGHMVKLQIDPPSRVNRTLDTRVDPICMKALQIDRNKRFESVGHLLEALMAILGTKRRRHELPSGVRTRRAWQRIDDPYDLMQTSISLLTASRETRQIDDEATALTNLGLAYSRIGKSEEAVRHLTDALSMAHTFGDRAIEADVLWAMSQPLEQLGERDRALEFAEQAYELYAVLGSVHAADVGKWLEKRRQ